jgi:hypothetical protein
VSSVSANQLSTETPMFGQRNVIIIIPKHPPDFAWRLRILVGAKRICRLP